MRIATSGFVDSFNPFTSIYLTPTNILRYVYESLVQNSAEDGTPTEGLAEKWEPNEDGTIWTFTLQDDLVWSDGEPITSADVKWTYEQMMTDPAMGTANGGLVSNFESVEAPDDLTVVITMKTPQASNPGLEIPVVPKHIWEGIDNPSEYANDADVVGSGPFLLTSYVANQSIVLEANESFWRGAPKIDGIEYVYYTNSDAQVQALIAGDVDLVTGLTPTQYTALEGREGVTTHSGIGRRYFSLSLNSGIATKDGEEYGDGAEALTDVKVRQAIRQAIDSQALLDNVLDGQGSVATSFIPSSFPDWYLPEDDSVIMEFDPEAAKSELESAGWTVGADGIREKDGERLSLRIFVDADDPTEQAVSEYLVPWLKDVGIELTPESTDTSTMDDAITVGNYDMYFTGWSVNPDPDYQLSINTCFNLPEADGSNGTTQDGYCNPEFDSLYEQQRSAIDLDARKALVRQMLELNYTDTAQVALWYANQLEAYRSDRFDGFTLMPAEGGMIANQAGYWGFLTVEPVASSASGSGTTTGLVVGGVVVLLALVGGGVYVARRRSNEADTE
jgi:ABC-type dipeptide transport system, periplasmic component